MGWAHLDLDGHWLVVQRGGVADFQHVDGVTDCAQLLMCDGLCCGVGVLDIEVCPHLAVFEFAFQHLKREAQGCSVARFKRLDFAFGDHGSIVTGWDGIAGGCWCDLGCVKGKGHDGLSGWGKWLVV